MLSTTDLIIKMYVVIDDAKDFVLYFSLEHIYKGNGDDKHIYTNCSCISIFNLFIRLLHWSVVGKIFPEVMVFLDVLFIICTCSIKNFHNLHILN